MKKYPNDDTNIVFHLHVVAVNLTSTVSNIEKQFQMAGKGGNEILEIVNPVEHTRFIAVDVKDHVPENGGT
jgi:hypothetical protein